ncbi:hypothetical protein J7L36_00675 [bacterium]|nr:hypothetical protein [bacterium]
MTQNLTELFLISFIENLPRAVGAILVFLIGLFISKQIANLVFRFLKKTRLSSALKRIGWQEVLARVEVRFDASKFFAELVRWFFILLFLAASAEIIGLPQFSEIIAQILGFFPNIFIAALIFIVAVFLADFSQKIMIAVLEKEKITYSRLFGKVLSWVIWILAILAILYQLKIAPTLILTIFVGVVALIVLTLGIAFGLGGKEIAAKILKELSEKLR